MPLNEQVLSAFRALRPTFTGKRPGKLGKYNDDGTPNADISAGLSSDYSWVRFNDDRAATRVKNIKVRREWGTDVWVEYNELTKEDEVREVHSILAPAVLGGDLAAAMNTPAVPANVSTPVSATDIQPLAVRPDATNGGLVVRILSGWAHGEWHDGSELLTLVPTATASKTAFVCVGIDSAGDPVQTLTANRAPTFPFYDGNGALTTTGAADIETVIAADPTTFWLWAFLLPNAVTAIDLTKQQDLRLWQVPETSGGGGGSLTSSSTALTGAVTLTSANTYYDVLSLSLAAGTWLINTYAATGLAAGEVYYGKLWDGSTVYASAQMFVINGAVGTLTFSALVTLGSTTTVKLSVASTGTSKTIEPTIYANNTGATSTSTQLIAVKIA